MFTVDASVRVNAFDQREPGHEISRQFLEVLRDQAISIVVPNLVLVEVAGAIARTRQAPGQASAFAEALSRLPHLMLKALDERCARIALHLASQHGLLGADVIYAAVAREAGSTLVTLDNEHLTRLPGLLSVCTPAAALAASRPQSPKAQAPYEVYATRPARLGRCRLPSRMDELVWMGPDIRCDPRQKFIVHKHPIATIEFLQFDPHSSDFCSSF